MQKTHITERALIQRINRKLRKDFQSVHCCREGSRGFNDLGRFYVVDDTRNAIADTHVDLEHLGRKLGVLQSYESMAE